MSKPIIIKRSQMRRNEWISWEWENVTANADPEPIYLRMRPRPIEQSVEAAQQFDEMRRAATMEPE